MQYLVIPILLLWISSDAIVAADLEMYLNIQQDLQDYNISCSSSDSCRQERSFDSLSYYSCVCDASCVQSDTCCLDSYYVDVPRPKLQPTCRKTSAGLTYMIDRCPSSDSVFENLCREEWKGDADALKIVPVTSLFTAITYKNYFCFKCNELNDDYVYWNVQLQNFSLDSNTASKLSNISIDKEGISLEYDQGRWMALVGNQSSLPVAVDFVVVVPDNIIKLVRNCIPSVVISNCSEDWSKEEVREQCEAYMGIKIVATGNKYRTYRNFHCALCNSEEPDDIYCERKTISGSGAGFGAGGFSFVHLLDVNPSDGNKVGKVQMCDGEDEIYDRFAKKCRKVTCVKVGYKPKAGKCEKE